MLIPSLVIGSARAPVRGRASATISPTQQQVAQREEQRARSPRPACGSLRERVGAREDDRRGAARAAHDPPDRQEQRGARAPTGCRRRGPGRGSCDLLLGHGRRRARTPPRTRRARRAPRAPISCARARAHACAARTGSGRRRRAARATRSTGSARPAQRGDELAGGVRARRLRAPRARDSRAARPTSERT